MKRRANLAFGCVLTLALVLGAAYGGLAAAGFLWWGRGFAGALAGRHAPERIRAATTVYVYDVVIETRADRVVFRRSLWASARRSAIFGLASALALMLAFALRKRKAPRILLAAVLALVTGATFAMSRAKTREVVVPRGAAPVLAIRPYQLGGGRSGTRHTTGFERGWEVVLRDGTLLVRLPWNDEQDAKIWRDLIAAKLAR